MRFPFREQWTRLLDTRRSTARAPAREAERVEAQASDALPARAPDTDQPVLSRNTLDQIRSIGSSGPKLLERVIEAFLASSPEYIVAIRKAVDDGNAQALIHAAHSLKSSSGNVGAARLGELCAAAEDAGHRGAVGDVATLLLEIETALSKVSDALRCELA